MNQAVASRSGAKKVWLSRYSDHNGRIEETDHESVSLLSWIRVLMTSVLRGGFLMKVEICDRKKNMRNDIERRDNGELDVLPTS